MAEADGTTTNSYVEIYNQTYGDTNGAPAKGIIKNVGMTNDIDVKIELYDQLTQINTDGYEVSLVPDEEHKYTTIDGWYSGIRIYVKSKVTNQTSDYKLRGWER